MRSNRYLIAAGVAAIVVHAASIAWVQFHAGRIDAHAFNSLDCGEYHAIARNILGHGTFSQDGEPPSSPDTWRTPGYPLLLAGAMLLVGESPTALIVIQHLAAIVSVLLFFKIASRHMSPRRVIVASVVVLLEPYHFFYAFWLLSTTFFTLALVVTWWVWERARECASVWRYSILGLMAGFLVLIWPGAILIPVFVLAGLLVMRPNASTSPHHNIATSPQKPRLAIALTAIACAAPPVAWMTRNKLVAGHFAFSHQSGIVLAYFKATEVELWRQGRTQDRYIETSLNPDKRELQHSVWDEIDQALCARMTGLRNPVPFYPLYAESKPFVFAMPECTELKWENLAQGNKTHWDSFQVSGALRAIGLYMLTHSLPATIGCGLTRIVENLVFPLGLAIKPAEGAPVNRFKAAGLGVAYTLLAGAAGIGLFRVRRNWPALYFPVACVLALALTTTPQIDPRFRVPLIPFLALLAFFPVRRAEP